LTDSSTEQKDERIDLTLQLKSQQAANQVFSNQYNDHISRTHNTIIDIQASISRLVPMSKELADTYSSSGQKTLMQWKECTMPAPLSQAT